MKKFGVSRMSKLYKEYPLIKLKYVQSINNARDILVNFKLGVECRLFHVPRCLKRCKLDLEFLRRARAENIYDECNNGPILDKIEQKLKTSIIKLEKLNQLYICSIEKELKNKLINRSRLSKLCKEHPLIKLKYIQSIKNARNILVNINLGFECYLYHIPRCLRRCKFDLEFLGQARAENSYDEHNYGIVLDRIQKKMRKMIGKLEKLNQLYECDIEKTLKKELLDHWQVEPVGKNILDV